MAQFAFDIVVENPHADVFGENAQLRSDMAVADDTQYLAPGFEGTLGRFPPNAVMGERGSFRHAAQQEKRLAQNQFRDRARVGIRSVENGDSPFPRGHQVNLIRADAKTPDAKELFRMGKNIPRQLGARPDADDLGVLDGFQQRLAVRRMGICFDIAIVASIENPNGARMDISERTIFILSLGMESMLTRKLLKCDIKGGREVENGSETGDDPPNRRDRQGSLIRGDCPL